MEQTRSLFCMCNSGVARCQLQHQCHSHLANEFDARSVLHEQVSLAAVNQICVIHKAMNGCKKSKDSLKACFENVSIKPSTKQKSIFHIFTGFEARYPKKKFS